MRYSRNNDFSSGCFAVVCLLAFKLALWIGLAALLGIWTNSNLDFWATYVKHTETHVPFVLAWVASLPLPLTFVADIIASIARFFV